MRAVASVTIHPPKPGPDREVSARIDRSLVGRCIVSLQVSGHAMPVVECSWGEWVNLLEAAARATVACSEEDA